MTCCAIQAAAKVNEELSKNIFRRVIGSKVVTPIEPAVDYYVAEDYHQHYLVGFRCFSPALCLAWRQNMAVGMLLQSATH